MSKLKKLSANLRIIHYALYDLIQNNKLKT